MKNYADDEYLVENVKKAKISDHQLIYPSYTHWTVAYALTLDGAKKLLKNDPIKRLLPVDEYLPIMFDKQPK